jgi:hypothetical protein
MNSCGWKCGVASGAAWLGLPRIAARAAGRRYLNDEERVVYRAGIVTPKVVRTTIATLAFLPKSGLQTREARSFGSVAITIMYSEKTREPSGSETADSVATWHAATLDSMRAILTGTTQPRGPIIVPGVTHTSMILDDNATRMIVEEVLRLARSAAPVEKP